MPVSYDDKIVRPNRNIPWTKEMAQEMMHCASDLQHFAMNQCKVLQGKKGIAPLEFRDYQKKLLNLFTKHERLIVLQSRQSGKCIFFDTIITIRNKKTNEKKQIKIGDFFEKLKKMEKVI